MSATGNLVRYTVKLVPDGQSEKLDITLKEKNETVPAIQRDFLERISQFDLLLKKLALHSKSSKLKNDAGDLRKTLTTLAKGGLSTPEGEQSVINASDSLELEKFKLVGIAKTHYLQKATNLLLQTGAIAAGLGAVFLCLILLMQNNSFVAANINVFKIVGILFVFAIVTNILRYFNFRHLEYKSVKDLVELNKRQYWQHVTFEIGLASVIVFVLHMLGTANFIETITSEKWKSVLGYILPSGDITQSQILMTGLVLAFAFVFLERNIFRGFTRFIQRLAHGYDAAKNFDGAPKADG